MMPLLIGRSARQQRGVASLIVVMVLFFVVSLMAAYTSRNLIFDQKTSANQARSTMAFEAAEAGVEWALTQLNGGRIDVGACAVAAGGQSFQQRYLAVAANGTITPAARAAGLAHNLWPTCVYNGTDWICTCPAAAADTPVNGTPGAGPFPAFRVWPASREPVALNSSPWLAEAVLRPGVMPITTTGCTRLPPTPANAADPTCLSFLPRSEMGDGTAVVHTAVALRSGLAVPPAAAVTVRGVVAPSVAAKLRVVNTAASSGGFTVNSGGAADPLLFEAQSLPGTPSAFSFAENDLRLASLNTTAAGGLTAGERMFVSIFGMKRATYREQPGLRACASPCASIHTLHADNPHRVIWVDGDLSLDANLGSAAAPVLLVVNGATLTLAAGVTVTGFVYIVGDGAGLATMVLPDAPTRIDGALAAEAQLTTTPAGPAGVLSVEYNPAVLGLLRTTYGSWVRLPGGWRDFKAN